MTSHDAEEILGIEPGMDFKDARRLYMRLLRNHKPETDPEGFQKVQSAWEAWSEWNKPSDAAPPADPEPTADRTVVQEIVQPLRVVYHHAEAGPDAPRQGGTATVVEPELPMARTREAPLQVLRTGPVGPMETAGQEVPEEAFVPVTAVEVALSVEDCHRRSLEIEVREDDIPHVTALVEHSMVWDPLLFDTSLNLVLNEYAQSTFLKEKSNLLPALNDWLGRVRAKLDVDEQEKLQLVLGLPPGWARHMEIRTWACLHLRHFNREELNTKKVKGFHPPRMYYLEEFEGLSNEMALFLQERHKVYGMVRRRSRVHAGSRGQSQDGGSSYGGLKMGFGVIFVVSILMKILLAMGNM